MKFMDVGYNLVETTQAGKKYEIFDGRMSIVELLRRIRKKKQIPNKVTVTVFDLFLVQNEEIWKYTRRIFTEGAEFCMRRNATIQILIEGTLVRNMEPNIRFMDKKIRLNPIFGNRLTQKEVDWYHAPFNI